MYILINILLAMIMFFPVLFPPMADIEPYRVKLSMEPESYLVIHGESNVHSFQCGYNKLNEDTLEIEVFWQDNCLIFQDAVINLETRAFDCGNRQMNRDMQDLLKSGDFPFISIEIICIDVSPGPIMPVRNNPAKISIIAGITIAGEKQQQRIPVEVLKSENERSYTGSIMVNLKDFNLNPPVKMFGLVKVDELIEVHFSIKISIIGQMTLVEEKR
jgi:hypothetical protein